MKTEQLEYALSKQLDIQADNVQITASNYGEITLTGKPARQAISAVRRIIKMELKNRETA